MSEYWNDTKAFPAWSLDELEQKVANAYRYGQNAPGIASAEAEFDAVEIDNHHAPPRGDRLFGVDWRDAAPVLDRPYLIDDVMDASAMVVTYGDSNVGKTFIALDQGFHIATGRDWNGHKVVQGLVVYVAAEGGTGFFKRIKAFKRHYKVDDLPFTTVPCPIDLQNGQADTRKLIQVIQSAETRHNAKCVLVVIDTLARAMAGGDENTAADMSKFVIHCDRIRAAIDATINIIHHTGKDKAKGARGSSALRAATDTEIEIDVGVLRVTKQRDMERTADMRFDLLPVEIGHRSDGKAVTACVVRWLSPAEVDFAAPIDGKQHEALTAFENALTAKDGEATVLSFTEWRTSYAAIRAAGGKKTGQNQALVRCSKSLIEAGYIAKTNTGQYVRTSKK
jgi:RecA-family ATPase